MQTFQSDYFTAYNNVKLTRDANGVLIVELHTNGGPCVWGNPGDPDIWSQIHDEGVQVLENIANIRVPVIAAIEGRAHVHSDYALLANVILVKLIQVLT